MNACKFANASGRTSRMALSAACSNRTNSPRFRRINSGSMTAPRGKPPTFTQIT